MDLEKNTLIIPTTATRSIQLAGGPPMEQAIPEDYVLASMVLRALESRNGQELEFVIKAYYPVMVVQSAIPNSCFLIELLGTSSGSIVPLPDLELTRIQSCINSASNPKALLKCIEDSRALVSSLFSSERVTVLGLMSGSVAEGISDLMDWPTINAIEPYALVLPEAISTGETERVFDTLSTTSRTANTTDEILSKLLDLVRNKVKSIVDGRTAESADKIHRLEQRVAVLRRETELLDSRLAQRGKKGDLVLERQLKARTDALRRDEERLRKLTSSTQKASKELMDEESSLRNDIKKAVAAIHKEMESLENFLVPLRGVEIHKQSSLLLIPFVMVGLSKKGRLTITVYPPSRLGEEKSRVGRLRDFADVFSPSSDSIAKIARDLTDRANKDVTLRKHIRSKSQEHSLFVSSVTKNLLREGVQALIADGLAKTSMMEDLESIIQGIPEQQLTPIRPKVLEVFPAVDEGCIVKFNIYDDSGSPVSGAHLELGAFRSSSDSKGVIVATLPKSNYEGRVTARGYRDKPLEFTIHSLGNVVIPIVLSPLSKEERLDRELDSLLKRADRIERIRERLWDAFEKQGTTLLTIPAYRSALVELLSELGYEPEAWISKAKNKKGMVRGLLKRDDRIDGIRRDILRLAEESKQAGGIMLFSELLVRLDDIGWATSSEDIESIIKNMSKEGLIEGLSTLESGAVLVNFIPVSLTDDPQQLMSLAADGSGNLTIEEAVVELGWTEERVKNALELLVAEGVAKVQKSYSKSTQYWFPGLRGKK